MKVAILFDAGSDEWSPQDVAAVVANVHEVRDVLRRRGHEVELLPVRLGDFRWLSRARRADLVFNLCEGINGHARFEDFVVGTLELTGVPFTGCRTWPTSVCHSLPGLVLRLRGVNWNVRCGVLVDRVHRHVGHVGIGRGRQLLSNEAVRRSAKATPVDRAENNPLPAVIQHDPLGQQRGFHRFQRFAGGIGWRSQGLGRIRAESCHAQLANFASSGV